MSWVSIIAIYPIVWWMLLYMLLPIGVAPDESRMSGTDSGAPAHPHIRAKIAAATVLAILVTWGVVEIAKVGLAYIRSSY